jgi:hypothetical protein
MYTQLNQPPLERNRVTRRLPESTNLNDNPRENDPLQNLLRTLYAVVFLLMLLTLLCVGRALENVAQDQNIGLTTGSSGVAARK